MSKILVSGGFGFLGGRIAQHLQAIGNSVVLGSRSKQPSPNWLPNSEVRQLIWNDQAQLSQACEDIDIVVHAAGMNAQECSKDPIGAIESNTLATTRLIEATKNSKVTKFIYLSTVHVYNSPLFGTISEKTPTKNFHPYATSHLMAEYAVNYASSLGYFQGMNLRLSNGFGAPTHKDVNIWNLLVNNLCLQAITKMSLTLKSNGNQKRDFIPILNIILLIGNLTHPDFRIPISCLNVASGFSISIFEMAELIQSRVRILYGKKPEIIVPVSLENEIDQDLVFDLSLMKKLNLIEKVDLIEEIDKLLQFCQINFGISKN